MPTTKNEVLDPASLAAERLGGWELSYVQKKPEVPTLETLVTSRDGLGLVTATPVQRAICRIIDGTPLGDLADHPDVITAIGGAKWEGTTPPKEVVIASAIRSAKSIIAAARAVQQTQTCDLSGLIVGEVPRVSVVSVRKDLAKVVFDYVVALAHSKLMEGKLVDQTVDTVTLRHPSGRRVEIKVTAGSRAGATLVARWSAGVIFDEAPRMVGAEDGVVNLDDARAATLGRMLPGATILYPGSPWAPWGPVFEMFRKGFGKPDVDLVVVKAAGYVMNPFHWTPQRCAELKERDPDVYETDVEANFADKLIAYLPASTVDKSMIDGLELEPYRDGHTYVAAMDPATRGNAWTFGIGTIDKDGIRRLVRAKQWQGTADEPLSPSAVIAEMAPILKEYKVDRVYTDQWSFDSIVDIGSVHKVYFDTISVTGPMKVDWFMSLRGWMIDNKLKMVDVPDLRDDMKRVQRQVTATGIRIEFPKTNDGRHCDYAAMVSMLFSQHMEEPVEPKPEPTEDEEWSSRIEKQLLERQAHGMRENDL